MKSSVLHPRSDSRNWPRSSECHTRVRFVRFVMSEYNTEFDDLRKIICLRKIVFDFLKLALVCRMQISGAWHTLHAIAEME